MYIYVHTHKTAVRGGDCIIEREKGARMGEKRKGGCVFLEQKYERVECWREASAM